MSPTRALVRRLAFALVPLGLLLAQPASAETTASDPCKKSIVQCGNGHDNVIDVSATRRTRPGVAAGPALAISGPSADYVRREYTPTCTGNTRLDGGTLCALAVSSCPQPGFVRFWVF